MPISFSSLLILGQFTAHREVAKIVGFQYTPHSVSPFVNILCEHLTTIFS